MAEATNEPAPRPEDIDGFPLNDLIFEPSMRISSPIADAFERLFEDRPDSIRTAFCELMRPLGIAFRVYLIRGERRCKEDEEDEGIDMPCVFLCLHREIANSIASNLNHPSILFFDVCPGDWEDSEATQ